MLPMSKSWEDLKNANENTFSRKVVCMNSFSMQAVNLHSFNQDFVVHSYCLIALNKKRISVPFSLCVSHVFSLFRSQITLHACIESSD